MKDVREIKNIQRFYVNLVNIFICMCLLHLNLIMSLKMKNAFAFKMATYSDLFNKKMVFVYNIQGDLKSQDKF